MIIRQNNEKMFQCNKLPVELVEKIEEMNFKVALYQQHHNLKKKPLHAVTFKMVNSKTQELN